MLQPVAISGETEGRFPGLSKFFYVFFFFIYTRCAHSARKCCETNISKGFRAQTTIRNKQRSRIYTTTCACFVQVVRVREESDARMSTRNQIRSGEPRDTIKIESRSSFVQQSRASCWNIHQTIIHIQERINEQIKHPRMRARARDYTERSDRVDGSIIGKTACHYSTVSKMSRWQQWWCTSRSRRLSVFMISQTPMCFKVFLFRASFYHENEAFINLSTVSISRASIFSIYFSNTCDFCGDLTEPITKIKNLI